jgi:type I restriction enzyme S subunit
MAAIDAERGSMAAAETRAFEEVQRGYPAFRDGDVIVAKITPCFQNGKAAVARDLLNGLGFGSTELHVFRPRGAVLPEILLHFIRRERFRREAADHMSGTAGHARLFADYFEGASIPVPPLAEQRRILAKVEALLAQSAAVRARLTSLPEAVPKLRQSILEAACSGHLTKDWRDKHPNVETAQSFMDQIWSDRRDRARQGDARSRSRKTGTLGPPAPESQGPFDLPETWRWVTWNDLADWITYGFTRPMPHASEGVPIVTAKNIAAGTIDFDRVDRTTQAAFDALSEKDRPRPGEILITKDGSIGRASVVRDARPFCINQSVARVLFGGTSADPDYLALVIASPLTQARLDQAARGSAIRHISITTFGRLPVPLPPLEEQREIVRRAEDRMALAEAIERRAASALEQVDALVQAILEKAFRGELVPTEADISRRDGGGYEPAQALIARLGRGRARVNEQRCSVATAKEVPL